MSNEEKMTNAFFNDADVLSAIRSNTIFDILSLKEENCTNILAWLLDPKEAHNKGNAFARHLLKACADKNGKVRALTLDDDKRNRYIDANDDKYFKEAFVYPEYMIKDSKCGRNGIAKGRIDLLVVDTQNDICLVIENKYGSREHGRQCKKYFKALKQLCRNQPQTKFIFIYLDVQSGSSECEEFINLDYDAVLNFKDEFPVDSMGYRLFKSWETDVNGYEEDEKLLKKLADKYGDALEKFKDKQPKFTNTKELLDTYFKNKDKNCLVYAEYEGIINEILNFKKHQSKVYEVRHSQEFADFLKSGSDDFDFSMSDYENTGDLTFSEPCFCNENGRWTVYGIISQTSKGYQFSIKYAVEKDDKVTQKKLAKFLNGNNSHKKKYAVCENYRDLFKYADAFFKDLAEAKKFF